MPFTDSVKPRPSRPVSPHALRHYTRRTLDDGGLYNDVERGISLGCPLPSWTGTIYRKLLDERMEATGLVHARFMDHGVILARRAGSSARRPAS